MPLSETLVSTRVAAIGLLHSMQRGAALSITSILLFLCRTVDVICTPVACRAGQLRGRKAGCQLQTMLEPRLRVVPVRIAEPATPSSLNLSGASEFAAVLVDLGLLASSAKYRAGKFNRGAARPF
jgi:hypothetical protein